MSEQDQPAAEAELRAFLERLPAPAQDLITDRGTVGYLVELHSRIADFIDVLDYEGAEAACGERQGLLELLPPLS